MNADATVEGRLRSLVNGSETEVFFAIQGRNYKAVDAPRF